MLLLTPPYSPRDLSGEESVHSGADRGVGNELGFRGWGLFKVPALALSWRGRRKAWQRAGGYPPPYTPTKSHPTHLASGWGPRKHLLSGSNTRDVVRQAEQVLVLTFGLDSTRAQWEGVGASTLDYQ